MPLWPMWRGSKLQKARFYFTVFEERRKLVYWFPKDIVFIIYFRIWGFRYFSAILVNFPLFSSALLFYLFSVSCASDNYFNRVPKLRVIRSHLLITYSASQIVRNRQCQFSDFFYCTLTNHGYSTFWRHFVFPLIFFFFFDTLWVK